MDFPYTKVVDFPQHKIRQRLLPWIRVGLFNPKFPENVIYVIGLVDSGAEATVVDREVGENLNFAIKKGTKQELKGLGGGTIKGFLHKVGFIVENPDNPEENIKYTDYAIFAKAELPRSMPQQTAIYGTLGFFCRLMVTFIYPQKIVIDRLSS